MGQSRSDFSSSFPEQRKFLMLGLDAAGKTTILYKMHWDDIISAIPTIGFNIETVELSKATLTIWDIGGEDKIRPLWRHFTKDANGLIWVVDSNDRERFGEAQRELFQFFDGPHADLAEKAQSRIQPLPVLIFLNKQDLPNATGTVEFVESLNLVASFRQFGVRNWTVQPCVSQTGQGLVEGFSWLARHTYVEGEYVPSDDDDSSSSN